MPDRIRGDGGGENVLICEDILRRRGMDRGSFIIGSSKFNTCIERMWRDLRRVVIQFYMDLFSSLERDGMSISYDGPSTSIYTSNTTGNRSI